MTQASLTAFSYLTTAGPTSLDIAKPLGTFRGGSCVGGVLPFSPACTFDFLFTYQPGIVGAVFVGGIGQPIAVSTDQPVVTMVSSTTTVP